jgi:hypothetical protein
VNSAAVPGTLAVWADVLHEGPVPSDDDLDAWFRIRAAFIAGTEWTGEAEALALYRHWQSALDTFDEHDEVVLWFEHDLFDQLLLIRHLAWWSRRDRGRTGLSLICIDRFRGVEPFHGLGQLEAEQLASLLPRRQRVTDAQVALAREAWSAFTSSNPMAIQRIVERNSEALPYLEGALRRFLEEFPSVGDGLGRTERQVLDILAEGPAQLGALFAANARREERVFMGDSTFRDRVRAMATAPLPLVEIARPNPEDSAALCLPDGEVRIAPFGREVAAGRASAVGRGIDRWFGGAHLVGSSPRWRWNREAGRLIEA